MKICGQELSPLIKLKDILIVVFGVVAGIVSAVTVIQAMAEHTTV